MKLHAMMTLAVGLLLAANVQADDAAKQELAKLNGTWSVVSYEREGQPVDITTGEGAIFKTAKLIIADDKYTVTIGDQTIDRGTWKAATADKHKAMDILPEGGPNNGKTFRIIYEVAGDSLKASYSKPNGDRPTEFKSKPGTGGFVFVYKRETKAGAKDDAKDLDQLQGTWLMMAQQVDGRRLPEERFWKLIVDRNKFTAVTPKMNYEFTLTINLNKNPKQIDVENVDGKCLGIYELDDDNLKICFGPPDRDERPKEFKTEAGKGQELSVFKREKPDKPKQGKGGLVFADKPKASADTKADKKDTDKLQGAWSLVSHETEGNKTPDDVTKGWKITLKGDKYTFDVGERTVEGTMKVDETKKPKVMDAESETDGKFLGIYELDGDNLKMCFGPPGGDERPKAFKTEEGKGQQLFVFKREKK